MAGIPGVIFVDPRAALVDAKGLLEVYRKTDSHWSMYGSFVGYGVLARALSALMPFDTIRASEVSFGFRPTFGDLGVGVIPERREDAPQVTVQRNPYEKVFASEGLRRNGALETRAHAASAGRLFLHRDSFFTFLAEYVARSVRDMSAVGSTTSFFIDEIDRWRPNVVVNEIGERRLFVYDTDHRRDGYDDLFRADFASEPGRAVQAALLLLGEGRVDEARARIAPIEAADARDPDHAYALAQIYEAAGLHDLAASAIAQARASFPDRPSFLSLEASAALARGDLRTALDRAEARARALRRTTGTITKSTRPC